MRKTLLALAGAAGLALTGFATPAHAVETAVTLDGGHVIAGGKSAWIDATITCPKGDRWEADGLFAFATIGRDDTYASENADQGGKCIGRAQSVKVKITAFYNPPIPQNCSAEYFIRFRFTNQPDPIVLGRGGADAATGPVICLT